MRVNVRLLALYLFSLFIMYLAGVYFGDVLFVLFIFFCFFPGLSLIVLIIWYIGLGSKQSFSTLMPVKGDMLDYRLMIFNKSFVPVPSVKVNFQSVSSALDAELPSFSIGVEPGAARRKIFRVRCLYRGEYEIGISSLEISDFFQLFSFRKKTKPTKLSVYPRIVELEPNSPIAAISSGNGNRVSAGMHSDPTLFKQLREYREGDSIRHIYWKKYASIGKPVLKEYEHTKRAGARIYFDTRKNQWNGINELEQEDVSVEILVSLVKHLLEKGVHTTVIASGWPEGSIASDEETAFEDFYRSTIDLKFGEEPSPAAAYFEDRRVGNLESQTVLFITHIIDPEIFTIREYAREHELHFLINSAGYPRKELSQINDILDSMKEYGAGGICIRGGDTIREDLGDRVAGKL